MPHHAAQCHTMPHHAICHTMPDYVRLCYTISNHATPCHIMCLMQAIFQLLLSISLGDSSVLLITFSLLASSVRTYMGFLECHPSELEHRWSEAACAVARSPLLLAGAPCTWQRGSGDGTPDMQRYATCLHASHAACHCCLSPGYALVLHSPPRVPQAPWFNVHVSTGAGAGTDEIRDANKG